jgi:cytochrome P450
MQGTDTQSIPELHFNPGAPGFDADPYPEFARIREGAPVYYWKPAQAYVVTRFEDVARVLRSPSLSSDPLSVGRPSMEEVLPEEVRAPFAQGLFRLAPRDHLRVRKAVSPALTPRAVERMRPAIQRLVDEALAPFEGKDEIEIAEFAEFIPLRVIAHMLAIPPEHEVLFRRFGEAIVSTIDPRLSQAERAEVLGPVPEGMALIRSIIAERRKNPGDDLLSALIRAEEAGDKLSEDEMLGLVAALIAGGSETTVHFIGYAVKSLLCVPERVDAIRKDPSLLRSALEEILRFDNFGKAGTMRYALEDFEVGGMTIPKGSAIMGLLPAALRDPRAFPDADTYDPRRQTEETLHFGTGPHFCLGASLARVEAEIAIRTFLDRYTDMRVVGEPVYAGHPIIRKLASLRVAVTPRAAS